MTPAKNEFKQIEGKQIAINMIDVKMAMMGKTKQGSIMVCVCTKVRSTDYCQDRDL